MPIVKLFANLRDAAGSKEVFLAGSNIRDLVLELVERYPALAPFLLDHGEISARIIITVNGHPTKDKKDAVMEQDEMAIFPPIAGG
jgi:molybdopterin synthase sulfur carrier subunit